MEGVLFSRSLQFTEREKLWIEFRNMNVAGELLRLQQTSDPQPVCAAGPFNNVVYILQRDLLNEVSNHVAGG